MIWLEVKTEGVAEPPYRYTCSNCGTLWMTVDADRQPPDECKACGAEKPTCSKCRYLQVINTDEVYAQCTKTGCVFRPFRLDTRKVYCDLGERKDDGE